MQPVSGTGLGIFRIGYGLIMLLELIQLRPYIVHDLLPSRFRFTYDGFDWLPALPFEAMNVFFWVLMVMAVGVILGFWLKWASRILVAGYLYAFLLDVGHYNNHYYLYILIGILLSFTQADRCLSIGNRGWKSPGIPRWQLLLLKVQIALVYFYGGISKLETDWLMGVQMELWLPEGEDIPVWGAVFSRETIVSLFSIGGVILDLSAGFLLFWKKSRKAIIAALLIFHLTNALIWNIGYFPWFMILSLVLFMDFSFVRGQAFQPPKRLTRALLIAFLCFQILFPLRRFLYSGHSSWTGQGHLFAWRMMLGDHVDRVRVFVGQEGEELVPVALEEYITRRQLQKASRTPKQYLKFAHFLAATARQNGATHPDVRMEVYKSLNGRPEQMLISPERNLANIPYPYFGKAHFLEPFAY